MFVFWFFNWVQHAAACNLEARCFLQSLFYRHLLIVPLIWITSGDDCFSISCSVRVGDLRRRETGWRSKCQLHYKIHVWYRRILEYLCLHSLLIVHAYFWDFRWKQANLGYLAWHSGTRQWQILSHSNLGGCVFAAAAAAAVAPAFALALASVSEAYDADWSNMLRVKDFWSVHYLKFQIALL